MDIQSEIINEAIKGLSNEFDNIVIEGLRLKGFEFDNQNDLHNFIKENCKAHDYPHHYTKIYYVKDIPFLQHNYSLQMPDFTEDFKGVINYGTYKYL